MRRAIRRDALAVAVAVAVFGFSFGVVAADAGLGVARTCAMSLLVFSGGALLAAVSVVAGGGSVAAAVTSALLLSGRLLAFGAAMAPHLGRGRRRLLGAQLVVDEPTAMALAHDDPDLARYAFWTTGILLYVLWNLSTLAGAALGGALGDETSRLGLDAAFPAAFIALLAPRLRERDARVAAAIGIAIAVVLVPLAPAGIPVVAAALAVPVALGVAR